MNIDSFILMKSEFLLLLIIFVLLFMKIAEKTDTNNNSTLRLVNILLFVNFIFGFFFNRNGMLFNNMFHTNEILQLEKNILNLGLFVISLQCTDWLRNHKHVPEFFILLLSTMLGMFFMMSSGHFLMFYLGLELSSIPLAILVNFDLEKPRSAEAAMKMILSSAFASAIMLFGISLVYGTTGTLRFDELSKIAGNSRLDILIIVFIMSGFAFKLSAVPFHLWTADVFEGAPVGVTSYLSVISKASVVFVFITIMQTLFVNLNVSWYNMIFLIIALTVTVGNIFAIRQNNMKRFLAFSSIAQVGYILLGLSVNTAMGASSAIFFVVAYLFSNLGAFGVVSIISSATDKENIDDLKGFYQNNPKLSWVFAISLFSLAGIPPTAGFFGKMFLITSGASKGNYLLIVIATLNMIVSLYYYLRIVKAMFIDKNDHPIENIKSSSTARLSLIICTAGIFITGFMSGLFDYIYKLFI